MNADMMNERKKKKKQMPGLGISGGGAIRGEMRLGNH